MKSMILLLVTLLTYNPGNDSLKVMFWNLENYFDWRNDSTSISDAEFSPRGERRWTRKRFRAKSNAIAKSILWAGAPDVIGLAEVENAFVLKRLLAETALRKLDYRIVHFESPDPRGIDVALLYRSHRLTLADAKPCHLYAEDSTVVPTRDILLAHFHTPEGADVTFLVNHHPSKYGGSEASGQRRAQAVRRLKELADSLGTIGPNTIIAMGDMNDTPANPIYKELAPALVNLAEPLYRRGEGTIKYDGAWELIDMIFASPRASVGPMHILRIPFLMAPDGAHAGTKPLRTYSGPRYLGGVSDHCPVSVILSL